MSPREPDSSSVQLSSPLSTPPETVKSLESSPATQPSPEAATKNGSPSPKTNGTVAPETATELQPSSPITSSAPQPTTKRGREDDVEEGSPPPKKAAPSTKAKSKAKPKAKPAAKKAPAPRKPAIKKPAPPPPPPSTRPSRTRKAPERFSSLQEVNPPKPITPKTRPTKVFDPTYITTNSTSRLGKADVYHMLLDPLAWSTLTPTQQTTLITMLPRSSAHTALLTRIHAGETANTRPTAFTLSNDCFRTDVAKFKEDLTNGHLAKTWLVEARQASVERARGDFDQWKKDEGEAWWGQKGGC